ncbi:MAG: hypothetical protein LBK73_08745 [Treponema sp.]|jgi:hypothetical protein|nr:hypothetical protein [Treponema sp.]
MDEEMEAIFSEGGYEDEEYTCHKCGKKFYLRVQDDGRGLDFDEGAGLCDVCGKPFCADCGEWRTYGNKYKKICTTCFNENILYDFAEWHDIFENEYCDRQCDGCPFFFKKGCMMILLRELVDMAFHTEGVKKNELERLQKRNRRAEKMWEEELRNAGVQKKQVGG